MLRDWAAPRIGKIVPTLAVDLMYPQSTELVGFYPLGFVAEADRPKIAIGETRTVKIWTKGDGETGIPTTQVWLFDESMTEEQIQDVLMFGRVAIELVETGRFRSFTLIARFKSLGIISAKSATEKTGF